MLEFSQHIPPEVQLCPRRRQWESAQQTSLELQIGARAQPFLVFIIGQSWQASLAVGYFPQPLQCVVSFERYHVVN